MADRPTPGWRLGTWFSLRQWARKKNVRFFFQQPPRFGARRPAVAVFPVLWTCSEWRSGALDTGRSARRAVGGTFRPRMADHGEPLAFPSASMPPPGSFYPWPPWALAARGLSRWRGGLARTPTPIPC